MYGFHNKYLHINMTDRSFREVPLDDQTLSNYLGGKGLATHLLLEHLPPGTDPLSAENIIIFTTGPAAATKIPAASRYGVFTKSPQTGIYCESYSGGHVAPIIKKTGYDAILITGKSDTPLYLHIHPNGVTFHDARHIWGMDSYATEDAINAEINIKDVQSVVIGPAGENLIAFSCISNNYWRCAGRGGVGAVLGSKKIKGIAFTGDKEAEVADPALLNNFITDLINRGKENAGVSAYRKLGTPMMVNVLNDSDAFPTRYWQDGRYSDYKKINADTMQAKFEVKPKACHRCFIGCGKLSTVREGKHQGLTVEGPEYETIYAFGGLCCINSIEDILYVNDLCDRWGIDTITAGNLAAFAIEAKKRGKLDNAPDYGDTEGIVQFLSDIVSRTNTGEIFANGIRKAASRLHLEELAIHVKGMEPAGYDPRVLKGMGLAYATSDRGACHLRATFYKPELSGMIEPDALEGKAELFIDFEDRLTLFDTFIFCRFFRDLIGWQELSTAIKALTGITMDKNKLQQLASRITDNTRRFNLREGVTAKDDTLPLRLMREPIGDKKQHLITEEELHYLVQDYYKLRGWNKEGCPPL
ncbi:MAG: aldehyde ferredoxin oxidoreductase family protein [Bacillota bacterium]|nr:aldehyde ferredoxin oxidoreductase family protein [Bacillota bacterium]MDW7684763.1 aldehyde ferredoxin oxidoreductase family protein [Bacillota bacterium]